MGTYIYSRTSKVIEAPEKGGIIFRFNVYQYYTKPWWEIWEYVGWDRMPSYLSTREKNILRGYNRFVEAARDRHEDMTVNGNISHFVIFAPDKWRGATELEVFYEDKTPPYMFDTGWEGAKAGTLFRTGRKWRFELKKLSHLPVGE